MVGTIVVGIDASGPSRAATDWALARAASLGESVELVHVIDERWLGESDADDGDVRDHAAMVLDAELTRAMAHSRGVAVSGRVVTGLPPRALIEASAGADLLVMGTHKTGFAYGRVFGSKFLSLVSGAECAVAVIPEFFGRSRVGVVAAAELNDTGLRAIEFATREAVRTGQVLVLVGAWVVESLNGHQAGSRSLIVEAATNAARDFDSQVMVRSRISDSTMSEALVAASSTASVLVLARPGDEADDPTLAVSHDVLANISSPVIVVDPQVASVVRER
ncbi:universal stress protein [Salinibacterium sp. G-O1]|uniref:universal stress protein n=1 Tax=Salinibacterium sp. G-O1 TaxID=3046208 RepID=UPI0024BAE120|nr:universal stress protein [Salinibacterium sp. G-O1]MDJ0335986.1 universal stress protein [Salinibacterium sp. G-O1]